MLRMLSGWTGSIERSMISRTDIPEQMRCRCLLERFRDFKDDILRFARDWRVPYTNNTAERAIRCARVKEKVSGCFRTKSGADDFARVLSFTSSAALHGVSSFDAIVAAFRGNAVGALFGVD